jgi:hypothetical protein
MALVKGPFTVKWGGNTITDVETVEVEQVVDSEEFNTVQGQNREIDGSYKATAVITLLASDIPALAAILPQNFVANGGVLSTGETVNNADGAIDIKAASCTLSTTFNNLDVISCVQKVMVKFIGEPADGEAITQFFADGSISVVS